MPNTISSTVLLGTNDSGPSSSCLHLRPINRSLIPRFQGGSGQAAGMPQRSMSSISGFGPSTSFDTASDLLEMAEDELVPDDDDDVIETQSERGTRIRAPHPSLRYFPMHSPSNAIMCAIVTDWIF